MEPRLVGEFEEYNEPDTFSPFLTEEAADKEQITIETLIEDGLFKDVKVTFDKVPLPTCSSEISCEQKEMFLDLIEADESNPEVDKMKILIEEISQKSKELLSWSVGLQSSFVKDTLIENLSLTCYKIKEYKELLFNNYF